jgi:hypothetical protein
MRVIRIVGDSKEPSRIKIFDAMTGEKVGLATSLTLHVNTASPLEATMMTTKFPERKPGDPAPYDLSSLVYQEEKVLVESISFVDLEARYGRDN